MTNERPLDFRDALNIVTPQPWDHTVDGRTITVRITVSKTTAAEAAITTTDLPALIGALDEPLTQIWEHQPHRPDGTAKPRLGERWGDDYGMSLAPVGEGFRVTVAEDTGDGIEGASVTLPQAQRRPFASALRRALDIAHGWES
ncbi:hypothetical protein PV726_32835 [Streptomyces europaeiscabiei]|uniref:hypothetical protein n=1 Tax=Streptomyces europaeiscabiei TaxID=146819 RepID=UPI0029B8A8B2|nr:hypothetical protein [Streptomyces europaeiscabiei]MDX3695043.1 hypothetical protein [Streptomyces europaeiscabiei]